MQKDAENNNEEKPNESGLPLLKKNPSMKNEGNTENGGPDQNSSTERDGTGVDEDKKVAPTGQHIDLLRAIYERLTGLNNVLLAKAEDKEINDKVAAEWALVSTVTDRFFLAVFIIVTTVIILKVFCI